uniref:Uncharacterized protein n=1 Tax=Palpitomonas bilix TaxID=652834 RepID=A0A7S3DDL0_9EUKA
MAVSFCRRMIAVRGSSELNKPFISVLYLGDSKADSSSRQDEEQGKEGGGKEEEWETPLCPSPSPAFPSLAYRTLLDELLVSACVSACFSPCLRLLAVMCRGGTLRVWYICSRHREVRWDEVKKEEVVVWSRPAPSPSLSRRCVNGDIPCFYPLLTFDISRAHPDDFERQYLDCYLVSTNQSALCVISSTHIYSWYVASTDELYARGGEQSEKTARKQSLSPPHLSFCCHECGGSKKDELFLRVHPGYPTAFQRVRFRADRVALWLHIDSADTGSRQEKERKEEGGLGADKPLVKYMCTGREKCNPLSPFGCGIRLADHRVQNIEESSVPKFFKFQIDHEMENTSRWSPSGELFAVSVLRRGLMKNIGNRFEGKAPSSF